MATPWRVRVKNLDRTTELTSDLPHIAGGTRESYGMQRGLWPPKSQIGRMSLPLIPPKAQVDAHADWPSVDIEALYDQLDYTQRVELYDRAAETVAGGPGSIDPFETYTLDRLPRELTRFGIEGTDTWSLLEKAQTERKDYFRDTAVNIMRYALQDWELVYGDDFATQDLIIQDGTNRPYDQHNTNPYAVWTAATINGHTGAQWNNPPANVRGVLTNRAALTNASYLPDSKVEAVLRIVANANNQLITGGVFVAIDPTTGAGLQVEFGVDTRPGAGKNALIHLKLFLMNNWAATSPTQLFDLPLQGDFIATDGSYLLEYQLTCLINAVGIRVLVNGLDVPGSTVLTGTSGLSVSGLAGGVGIYGFNSGGSGGSTLPYVFGRNLYQWTRRNEMQLDPAFPVGSGRTLEVQFNQASGLEMLMIAANAENLDLRKLPKTDIDLVTASPPPTPIGGVHSPPIVSNPGFESGLTGWTVGGYVRHSGVDTPIAPVIDTSRFHAGTASLKLAYAESDPLNDSSLLWAYQTITVPAAGGFLEVWRWTEAATPTNDAGDQNISLFPTTWDPSSNPYFPRPLVEIFDADFLTATDPENSGAWLRARIDVGAVAGQTVRLGIVVDQYGQTTSMWVDDFQFYDYAPIVFTEEPSPPDGTGNVITAKESDNASKFATSLNVQGGARGNSPTVYQARNLKAIRKYGLWTVQENLDQIQDYASLMNAGDISAILSGQPSSAREVEVWDGPATKGLWTVKSTGRFRLPHIEDALADSDRLILGLKETEGVDKKTLYLDQYPLTLALPDVQKLQTGLDNIIGQAMVYRTPPVGQPGVQQQGDSGLQVFGPDGFPTFSILPPDWLPMLGDGSGGLMPVGSGSGVVLIGRGNVPSDISLPHAYAQGDSFLVGQVPFNLFDHPCNVIAICYGTLLYEGDPTVSDVNSWLGLQLCIGPNVTSPQQTSRSIKLGLMDGPPGTPMGGGRFTPFTLVVPNVSPFDPGAYHAFLQAGPNGDAGTIVDGSAEILVFCV